MVTPYIAPKFKLQMKRTVELPFIGIIGAGGFLTIVSSPLMYKFRILQVKMIFTDDANNLVLHEWLTSGNRNVSTTGRPDGINIFGRDAPIATFIGKGIVRIANTNVEINEEGQHIKLYTFNGTGYIYNINGSITIQEL